MPEDVAMQATSAGAIRRIVDRIPLAEDLLSFAVFCENV